MNNLREKKYIWLPALLLIYTGAMAWIYRDAVTVHHDYTSYFATLGVELVVIVLLFFFLRKKARLKKEREDRENKF